MRIEVGYGLEGTLTDLHTKLIIENTMVPAFRAGDFSGGISRAVDDMIMVLEGNAAELEARGKRNPATRFQPIDPIDRACSSCIWGTLFFGGFAMAILPPIFGRKIGPGRYRWLGMDFNVQLAGSSARSSAAAAGRREAPAAAAGRPAAAAAAASPAAADRPAAAARRGAGETDGTRR